MGTLGTIYAEGLPKATGQRHLPSGKSSGDSPPGDVFQENGSLLNWLQYSVEPLSSLHNCTGRRLLPFLSRRTALDPVCGERACRGRARCQGRANREFPDGPRCRARRASLV